MGGAEDGARLPRSLGLAGFTTATLRAVAKDVTSIDTCITGYRFDEWLVKLVMPSRAIAAEDTSNAV